MWKDSERNSEGYDLQRETSSQFLQTTFYSSPQKSGRLIDSETELKFGRGQPNNSIDTEYINTDEDIINADKKGVIMFSSNKNCENLEREHRYDKGSKLNIISTLGEKQFSCGKCNKQYESKRGVYLHTKSVHEGATYSCSKCDYKST